MAAFYERHILYRDDSLDPSGNHVGRGFGLQVMGGKLDAEGKLQALITWVLPGGPADKVGLRADDKIIEWDGKCLLDMSYEQVAEVIESSANIAELLVKPTPQRLNDPNQPPANYVRSQRRLSQQTERDLRRHSRHQSVVGPLAQQVAAPTSGGQQRRMSSAQVAAANGSGTAGGRLGTGRRLPQIPATASKSNENTSQLGLSSGGGGVGVAGAGATRHASTSQLDQQLTSTSSTSNLIYAQASSGGFMTHSGNHLNAFHHHHHHATPSEQQSRSASELNRGSLLALACGYQQPLVSGYGASQHASGWAAQQQQQQQQQQQYGGSQQMMPTNHQLSATLASQYNGQFMNNNQNNQNSQHNNSYSLSAGQPQEISGLIGLQVTVDERLATLEISILSAHNIDRDPSLDYVVRVRILPDGLQVVFFSLSRLTFSHTLANNRNRFRTCTTQPSADMNWKETFLFQNFPIQKVSRPPTRRIPEI
ncbi:regulating synaptic membrane exocytosis 2 isoform X1 [Olea europaea subsp. europaea]|uniref:Regulating synaptic membrane exocytosis 2 isoform X1 n=1 Tax=Olea europaea subsp. europaea TaxID=158383 RepID=A0A8S0TL80_OLEEU|nr:regulating synaptic membrane exocytosis 2 isoform X1 [Olea europaea subsp. europaea]